MKMVILKTTLLSICSVGYSQSPVQRAVLDESHWASSRANAMAGAVSPIANGMDSAYYNPAGIGGIRDYKSRPTIHQLYFPYFAFAVNKYSLELNEDLSKASNLNDSAIVSQLLQAYQDQRQYGRFSLVPTISVLRMVFSYVYDTQIAAAVTETGSNEIDLRARTVTGPSFGFSFANNAKTFSLGLYSGYFERKEITATVPFASLNDPDLRKQVFNDNSSKYIGLPLHIGVLWVISKNWSPTLSLVFRNMGNTKYRNKDESLEDLEVPEDMTLGFSISPELGKWGHLSFVLEGHKLTDKDTATSKKTRAGIEFNMGDRFGANAGFSLRAGYNDAGLSYGLGGNLGILGLNISSFSEDVGVNNKRVIEQRFVANFAVNIADF